tara:strand:- start:9665 stop:10036 length:372 start_codon:yes stop_codon:yes gene_type:complete
MADRTGEVEGKDMCTDVSNINGVAVADIKGVQGKDKKSCATCTALALAYDGRACEAACGGRVCGEYYTDGTVGGLTLGNKLYVDGSCVDCVPDGFYSDRPCRGDQRVCFTVSSCVIIRVDICR